MSTRTASHAGAARSAVDRPGGARRARPSAIGVLVFVRDRGMLLLWVVMLAAFSVWGAPHFATLTNAMLIVGAAAVTAIFAAGVGIGVLSGVLDLSIPGTAALAGVITAKLITGHTPVWFGLAAGLGTGVVVGVINGLLTLRGLNPLVVTIGSLSVLTGLAAVVSQGLPIFGLDQLAFLGTDTYWRIPAPAFVVAAVYLVGWFGLSQTRVGVRMLAVGGNAEAARRAGVPVARYQVLGFVISGCCAALGGIVTAATVTQASAAASTGVLFDALTAVALSGMPLTGGRGSLPRVLVGSLIIATISSALVIRNIEPYWTTVVTGALLVGALGAERALNRGISARLAGKEAA